jgi:hypothetical protein
MPKCTLTFSRGKTNLFSVESLLKVAILLGVALLLSAQPAFARDALKFFKNYFVTGNYVVGGVGLRGQGVTNAATQATTGGVSTYATGVIHMKGVPGYVANRVPQHADIVAAYLYWETLATPDTNPNLLALGTFRGLKIEGTPIEPPGTLACWGSGGGNGTQKGAQLLYVFRADVLKYLPYPISVPATGKPGQRLVNDADLAANGFPPLTVSLPDGGSAGSQSPSTAHQAFLTEGASLVVVYRTGGDPGGRPPLTSVVIYDGGYTFNSSNPLMTQTIQGFYEASTSNPVAQMTHIVGDGRSNFQEQLTVHDFVPTGVSPNHPFPGALGSGWDNLTFPVGNLMSGDDSSIYTTVTPGHAAATACLSWAAIVLSTTVQDTDGDGLLDIWEKTSGLTDPNGQPLPDIHSMGADPKVQDIFVEIDYMCSSMTNGVCDTFQGTHTHLPTQAALDKVGAAFKGKGIQIHFDVGNHYQGDQYVVLSNLARGGDALPETPCGLMQSPTCLFPSFPGTVSWKDGFQVIKNGGTFGGAPLPPHFDHNRKDMFHYVVSAHALALPRWRTNDKSLTSLVVAAGGGATATVTIGASQGPSSGTQIPITILGAPAASKLNSTLAVPTYNATVAVLSSTSTTKTLTLTFSTAATAGIYQNWGLVISDGTPRSNSGVSDVGGGDLMITLGLWDNFVGTDFMQASTLLHELGHNLDLGHGGDVADPVNCKPNYQSSMSYLFQVQGLQDANGVAHIDYSNQALPTLNESSLNESLAWGNLAPAQLTYLPRWYALSSFPIPLNQATPASKHCDGTPITIPNAPGVFRIDGTSVNTSSLDWDNEGSLLLSNSVPPQDINFDGTIAAAPGYQGYNDWAKVNLQQVGARRGAAGSSDDLSPGQDMGDDLGIAGGDLGIAGGDLGIAGGDLGIAGGDLGIAGGDLGIAGGDLGGELDFETAKAVPSAPSALMAAAVTDGVDLKWSPPNVGTAASYTVWRAMCTSGTTVATCTNTGPAPLATSVSPTAVCDTSFNYCDNLTTSSTDDDAFYLYFVTATFNDVPATTSGPSNQVVQTELDLAAAVPTGLTATSITDGVGLKWNAPSFGTVITYTVWRATCPDQACATPTPGTLTSFPVLPTNSCSDGFNFCDNFITDGTDDDAYYIYYVTATFGDDASGPSNTVVGSEIMGGNNDAL